MNLQRQQRLSDIFTNSQQFAALGAQGFTGLANQVSQIAGLNINYDDYQRQLKDKQAKDKLSEFKRAREEELKRLDLMADERRDPLGKITMTQPTAWGKLASSALTAGGAALGFMVGGPGGAAIGSSIGGAIGGEIAGPTTINGIDQNFGQYGSPGASGTGGMDIQKILTSLFGGGGGQSQMSQQLGFNTKKYANTGKAGQQPSWL